MARISDITVKEQLAYCFVSLRKTIDFATEFETFTSSGFQKIMDYLDSQNILVCDGPIVCFRNMDLERLDVEVGFPAAKCMKGNCEIQARMVPAQKVVTAIDLGAYEEQDPTLEDLFSWIQQHECKPLGVIYYQYLNDTNRPASEYLTKMMIPIQ
ncbi:MAG: GyrI-like domain-containing protein [Candidatus Gastranaerophilaceae bacterium]|nr:GyrI-like domain-containing protein [Christensenellales bacterium]